MGVNHVSCAKHIRRPRNTALSALASGKKVDLLGPEAAGDGTESGFAVGAGDGTLLRYPHVAGAAAATTLTLRVAAVAGSAASVEVRANSTSGPLLATCEVAAKHHTSSSSTSASAFQDLECAVAAPGGDSEMELLMLVRGEAAEGMLVQLDNFWFN